ncbi:MAG: carboxypeptidase regulatory-like domain-containing protein [Anaerolineales bacterium]|nr:MAG: carboxypeptidase regulatory-like domain-containing protein [Anaerolineales bacterium]
MNMKKTSLTLRIGLIALLVFLFLSPGPFSPPAPALAAGFVNFLTNPGLETFDASYGDYDGYELRVAQNWTAFKKSGATPNYMTNDEWANMTGGAAEHLEGDHSQMYWETGAFAAGIYQQVSVEAGTDYAAQASILTIWETSASHTDDKMLKQVGIDPNGGTEPDSPDIVWGLARGKDVQWESVKTSATAISSTITLFVLVTSEASSSPSLRNQVFVDAVVLTEAPTASATSPALSTDLSFTVEWSGTPAYSGDSLEYDVEYKVDDGSWTFWKGKTGSTSAAFGPTSPTTVEYGHTYHFRARGWEDYGYYGSIKVKLPGVFADGSGDTSTSVGGIYGYVRNHWGSPIGGATVTISGTASSTNTDGSGYYGLPLLPAEGSYEVTASHSAYSSPPPIAIDVYSTTTTIPLTFTLRPPDDVVVNGDFEGDLSGWTTTGTAPTVVTSPLRSGDYSLAMSGNSGITQAHSVSGMHEPNLSFWYKIVTSETTGNDSFRACLYQNTPSDCTATFTVTPTADVDWSHQWLALGLDEVYTGSVGISFTLEQDGTEPTTVYLDEVSLGKGPYQIYLPLTVKGYGG